MSFDRHRDGLFWSSLFSISGEQKKHILNRIKESQLDYTSQWLATKMLEFSGMRRIFDYRADDHCMQTACERVALKFMLCDSDFAKDILSDEELEKANDVYARKQYNSKILKKLLSHFLVLLNHFQSLVIRIGSILQFRLLMNFVRCKRRKLAVRLVN